VNTQDAETQQHKIFLDAFIACRDVAKSAEIAGITNPTTIKNLYLKYKNVYKALFEKLEMPEESMLTNMISVAKTSSSDNARLKALEMMLKLTGAMNDGSVIINVNTDETRKTAEEEYKLYIKIKAQPELEQNLLEVMEGRNAATNQAE
jgi:hypothetical protein